MAAGQKVLLVGPPGCGKTARINSLAAQCNRRVVVMRAGMSERVDFSGCMMPDAANGVTRILPLDLLKDLKETKQDTLLFLDDLGQTPSDVQPSLMKLFDKGELSESVLIWGATNRPGDKAGVHSLCEPLRSRFDSCYCVATPEQTDGQGQYLSDWQTELNGWLQWASDNGAPAEVLAWHKQSNGRTLYTWKPHSDFSVRMPDFRSWATLIDRWNKGLRSLAQCCAVLGKGVATEFLAFASLRGQLPTPDEVWLHPESAKLPSEPSAQYFIACILAAAVKPTCAEAFCTYISRLNEVVCAYCAQEAYRRLGANFSASKAWCKWFAEHKELFSIVG